MAGARSRGDTDGDRAGGSRIATLRRAIGYLRPHRFVTGVALVCLLTQSLLMLAPFVVVERIIKHLQHPGGSFTTVLLLGVAGLGLVAVAGLVGVLRTWLVLCTVTTVIAELRDQIVRRLLGQSVSYFTSARGGELLSRLLNDVGVVDSALRASSIALVGNAVTAVACVVVMAVVDWRLTIATVVLLPFLAVAIRIGGRTVYNTRLTLQESVAEFTAHSQETLGLSGVMLVKSFGREASESARSAGLTDDIRLREMRAGMTATWIGLGLQLGQLLVPLLLLLTGGWLIVHDDVHLSTVIAFVSVLALRFGSSLAAVGNSAINISGALPAWDRIFAILDEHVTIVDRPDAVTLDDANAEIRLEHVRYTYPGQSRPAIDGVSLDVAPGQLVALVGPSGAGKTTLTSLLARFYDPDEGSISIGGHDLRDLKLQSIADEIGLVLQDTHLFNGTLRENLLYAKPGADEQAVLAACRDAYLDIVIAELADGLDTVVGERGYRLSGGEKQRVAIARAILKDAPILILDEATSHLDSASEQLVQAALASVFGGRTAFVIAHRLSTVMAADLIVVLDRGRVVEQGTHAELVNAGGLYAHLYEIQFRGPDDEFAVPEAPELRPR